MIGAAERKVLDALAGAVYITDLDGTITYYNEAAAELWGRRPVIGQDKWCGSLRLFTADGAPLPLDQCPMAVALRTGRPVRDVEIIAERPDGRRVRLLPAPTPLTDDAGKVIGAINSLTDITAMHIAEADARRLAAIVTQSDDAIISKTLEGRILTWNSGATRVFGYAEDEMIGESITKLIPPELLSEEDYVLSRLRRGERIDHYETVRVRKDGRRIDISLTVSPLYSRTGAIVGASKIARDITERRQAERAQALMMGELSHRVKNTLATVQAIATQSLRRSRNPTEFVQAFTGRVHALARAHDLLSETRWEGVSLGALVRDQVFLGVADERISSGGPELMLEAQPALHLAMVLHELGTNARKYGALSGGQGLLSVTWEVIMRHDSRLLRLTWRESNGPRVAAPTARGFGTRLIEDSLLAHGGTANIVYGADGVVCELTLPLPQVPGTLARPLGSLPVGAHDVADRARLHGKRVLVAEDEPLIAMELETMLRDSGVSVVGPAGDVAHALHIAQTQACDAALLDANLAGEPADELAALLTRKGIPFAFITGYGAQALPEAFRKAPLINKPFRREEIAAALLDLIQRRTDPDVYQLGALRR